MANKKKKTLSALDKAFIAASGMPCSNPVQYHQQLLEFRRDKNRIIEILGLTDSLTAPPAQTDEARQILEYIFKEENSLAYSALARDLVLVTWSSNKQVYTLMPEAKETIQKLNLDKSTMSFDLLVASACSSPIYVEFPENKNTNKIYGAFCGTLSLANKAFSESIDIGDASVFIAVVLQKNDAHLFIHAGSDIPICKACNERSIKKAEILELLDAIIYIGYVNNAIDKETVLRPIPKNNIIQYEVHPFPDNDNIPDFSTPDGWIKGGLCGILNFVSRDNLIKDLQASVNKYGQDFLDSYEYTTTDEDIEKAFVKNILLKWEQSRNIYQYNKNLVDFFYNEYLDKVLMNGIPQKLAQYMPYPTILFLPKESIPLTLISKCKIKGGKDGIFIILLSDDDIWTAEFPFDEPPVNHINAKFLWHAEEFLEGLSGFYHLLTVLEKKTIKAFEKELLTKGNPEKGELVPLEKPRQYQHHIKDDDHSMIRQGLPIEDVPLSFFDVTRKTVKRLSDKEVLKQHGWSMVPHTRRRHPHRYWVGTGENKHLEIRWLDEMNINKKVKTQSTSITVHEIRSNTQQPSLPAAADTQ